MGETKKVGGRKEGGGTCAMGEVEEDEMGRRFGENGGWRNGLVCRTKGTEEGEMDERRGERDPVRREGKMDG